MQRSLICSLVDTGECVLVRLQLHAGEWPACCAGELSHTDQHTDIIIYIILHHIASQCTVLHHIAYIAMYSQYCTVLFLIRRNKIGADSCQTFPPARVTVFRTGSEEPLEARRDKLWKMLALVEGKAADMTQQF